MESLGQLTTEGGSLYQADPSKKGAYDYKHGAGALIAAGEFRQAIRELTKMLFLGTKSGDEQILAYAKLYLAMAYSFSGALDQANTYAEQSMAHWVRPGSNRNDTHGWGNKILGDVAMRRGDPSGAILKYQKSIDVVDGDLRFFSRASLASAYANAGQMDKAKEMVTNAESFIGVVGARSKAGADATLFRLKADIAMRESRFSDAAKMFEDAFGAIEKSGGSDAPYEKFRAFEGIGRAKIAGGDKVGALKAYLAAVTISEQVRARFRSEEVTSGLFGQMQYVFNESVALLMESGQAEAAWDISERGRARALLDMVRNRVSLSAGSNVFADSLAKSVKSAEVASLLKAGDVLVEYHVTDKKTYAWVMRSAGMSGVSLDMGRSQLAKQVEEFRDAVSEEKSGSSQFGKRLYDTLVKPLGLKSGERLVIVPHDALHYLPFQALQSESAYLIETFPISYAPSASTFVAVMQREMAKKGPLLALANPDLNDPKLALPGAQIEVEHIQALFPGSEAYFKADATKDRLFQGAGKARLIHIAAHALADPVDPLYSHVYLAASNGKSGTLDAREVYGMDLKGTALVALSACQSGLGKVSQGDEIWGFTRSFLSAGSSSVLASLWSVSDDATEMLMTKFYQGVGKADARQSLRAAQIAVLKDPRFSHPFYWAPFNLVGDWR
jgi:CHAT domain-containing protein